MSTLKHGLNAPSRGGSSTRPPPGKRKGIFDSDSDSEGTNGPEILGGPPKPSGLQTKKPPSRDSVNLSANLTRKKHDEAAKAVDEGIYDYDAAYTRLDSARKAKESERKAEAAAGKPRYMTSLLASAEVRKRDLQRAKDRVIAREREAEGDDFEDKEKFVTQAYRDQQAEYQKEEALEKEREAKEAKKGRGGMTGFYAREMEREEQRHAEAMRAVETGGTSSAMGEGQEKEEEKEKTAADLAREINARGGNVMINEEGQVADKRQLLTAGLNVVPKKKVTADNNNNSAERRRHPRDESSPGGQGDQEYYSSSHGIRRDRTAKRERESRMMEEQLEKAAKRAADQEAEERRERERKAKSAKTEGDISSARERFLARKAAAAAAATATATAGAASTDKNP